MLVVQGYPIKYVLMFPIPPKNALTIAALLVHQMFYRFEFPNKIQSDKGSELNNLLLRGILDGASVNQSISSAYHPMSQGSGERFNDTMKTYLSRILKSEEMNHWDMVLTRNEFSCNVSVHGSTLLSPFEMLDGYRPDYPLDIILLNSSVSCQVIRLHCVSMSMDTIDIFSSLHIDFNELLFSTTHYLCNVNSASSSGS